MSSFERLVTMKPGFWFHADPAIPDVPRGAWIKFPNGWSVSIRNGYDTHTSDADVSPTHKGPTSTVEAYVIDPAGEPVAMNWYLRGEQPEPSLEIIVHDVDPALFTALLELVSRFPPLALSSVRESLLDPN